MGSGELVLCCFQLVRERNKGHRAQDPAATLMVKLTTAGEGWTWRTDGGVRQGLPLRVSLGSVDPVLGAMKDHQRLFKAKICYLYGGRDAPSTTGKVQDGMGKGRCRRHR